MKKHEFKEGDCFIPSSVEAGNRFLNLARKLGYFVFDYQYSESFSSKIEYWKCRDGLIGFIPCNSAIPNYSEEQMFAFLEYSCMDSLGNPIKEGDSVYVSDISIKHALADKNDRIFFTQKGVSHFTVESCSTEAYKKNEKFSLTRWNYVVSVNSFPKEKKVTLNSQYDAIVTKDLVTVGCQTFSKEIVLQVFEALKSFE